MVVRLIELVLTLTLMVVALKVVWLMIKKK